MRIFGRARARIGLIGAVEEHLHLIAPHDCKNWWRFRGEAHAVAIPIAGDLETEHVAVILGRPHQIQSGELGHCGNEAGCGCFLAHRVALLNSYLTIVPTHRGPR